MNPCLMKKKQIALLASEGLGAQAAQDLREHLRACPGCREYWIDITQVCRDQMRAADHLPEAEADLSFHRRFQQQLIKWDAPAAMEGTSLISRYFTGWTLAWPVAMMVTLGLVLFFSGSHKRTVEPRPAVASFFAPPVTVTDAPPTLSRYRLALSRSFDEFDELLNRHTAHRPDSAEPVIVAAVRRVPPDWP